MHYDLILLIQCNLAKYHYLANGADYGISIRKVNKTTREVLKSGSLTKNMRPMFLNRPSTSHINRIDTQSQSYFYYCGLCK